MRACVRTDSKVRRKRPLAPRPLPLILTSMIAYILDSERPPARYTAGLLAFILWAPSSSSTAYGNSRASLRHRAILIGKQIGGRLASVDHIETSDFRPLPDIRLCRSRERLGFPLVFYTCSDSHLVTLALILDPWASGQVADRVDVPRRH